MRSVTIESCKPTVRQFVATVLLTILAGIASPVFAQLAITCPADITVSNDPGVCSASVAYSAPIVTGAALPITVTTVPASGATFPVGTNTVLCTVTDANTNTTSCIFTITVVDAEAPAITNVNLSKSLLWPPNHKMVPVTVNYDIVDNCDGETTTTLSI
ncbi:MAG: HYR domain-containing protein [Verrucomicrobiota bacterium]